MDTLEPQLPYSMLDDDTHNHSGVPVIGTFASSNCPLADSVSFSAYRGQAGPHAVVVVEEREKAAASVIVVQVGDQESDELCIEIFVFDAVNTGGQAR